MLVLPQMCLVSSAGDENECGQGAAHTTPNNRGEARYSRQPNTAEMKLKGGLTLVDEPILQQQRSLVNVFEI